MLYVVALQYPTNLLGDRSQLWALKKKCKNEDFSLKCEEAVEETPSNPAPGTQQTPDPNGVRRSANK